MRATPPRTSRRGQGVSARRWWRRVSVAGLLVVVVLATARLSRWPATWFDEGMHLHVPKALVQAGVYADRSSEGFRYRSDARGGADRPAADRRLVRGLWRRPAAGARGDGRVPRGVCRAVYTFGRRPAGPSSASCRRRWRSRRLRRRSSNTGGRWSARCRPGCSSSGSPLWRRAWMGRRGPGSIAAGVVLGLGQHHQARGRAGTRARDAHRVGSIVPTTGTTRRACSWCQGWCACSCS